MDRKWKHIHMKMVKRFKADKRAAKQEVEQVAQETAERLAIEPSKWKSEGTIVKVCNWSGPHFSFWCLFHRKRRVALIRIPGTRGGCEDCRTGARWNNSIYSRRDHLSLHLGPDGKIRRFGHTKIFEARLMDRPTAKSIRAIIPKLRAME
jgi:hypothetical protein